MNEALQALVGKLPTKFQPYAKAILPLASTAVATGVAWAVTHTLDTYALAIAATGAGGSLVALIFPNRPKLVQLSEETLGELFGVPQDELPELPSADRAEAVATPDEPVVS